MRIRDPGWKIFGSGINISDPQNWSVSKTIVTNRHCLGLKMDANNRTFDGIFEKIFVAVLWGVHIFRKTRYRTQEQCCGSITFWYGSESADPCLLKQCCGSMTFWRRSGSGSGSADPCLWLMDPDPDPAIFSSLTFRMPIKNIFSKMFLCLLFF